MRFAIIRQRIKVWMLPIAMMCGVLFHNYIGAISFVAPYLIFAMLLITFCKVRPAEIRVTALSWWLLAVQLLGSVAVYMVLSRWDSVIAQGVFICVFCPTATAAPVITGMLGGSVPRLATFSIVSNLSVAVTAPFIFAAVGDGAVSPTFMDSCGLIASRVVPLIFAPLIIAFILQYRFPRVHREIESRQQLSFYIWAVSLIIVVGNAVSFVMSEPAGCIPEMLCLTLFAGIACCLQFWVGRKIGRKCGDRIAGAQGLGQKNTVLAIWMALSYLNPLASVAPAAYVAWQNTINSLQLYFKAKEKPI